MAEMAENQMLLGPGKFMPEVWICADGLEDSRKEDLAWQELHAMQQIADRRQREDLAKLMDSKVRSR